MEDWNIINSCRAVTASCRSQIKLPRATNVKAQISVSVKQNQIDSDLISLNSLLLQPNSVNASLSRSIASHAQSLVSGTYRAQSPNSDHADTSASESSASVINGSAGSSSAILSSSQPADSFDSAEDRNRSAVSSSSALINDRHSVSNSLSAVIKRHNQAIKSARAEKNYTRSRLHISHSASDSVDRSSASADRFRRQSVDVDVDQVYSREVHRIAQAALRSNSANVTSWATSSVRHSPKASYQEQSSSAKSSSMTSERDQDAQQSASSGRARFRSADLHLNRKPADFSPDNGIRNTLSFDKIDHKNASDTSLGNNGSGSNENKNVRPQKELHGLEHHVAHVQSSSAINRYMKNFALAIMTVVITIFLIGVVSYASTLF